MLILSADDVRKALPMKDAIEAMKAGYAALSSGKADVPLRTRISIPAHDAISLFMPAYVQTSEGEALAVKVVSLFPENPKRGLKYIQAVVLVMDASTGKAVALLEGSSLTAIRTGAGSGAAIDLLARKDSKVVAIIGAGVQGKTQLEAACTVRAIEKVLIYDTDPIKSRELASSVAGFNRMPKDIMAAASPAEAVRHADIVCTATTSHTPVFEDTSLKTGVHISAIGSYTPEMQEVPAETILRAKVVVDSRSAVLAESGDLIKPMQNGWITKEHIHAELGEIVSGSKPGRESTEDITYFKSVGVAVQDALAAQLAVAKALEFQLGRQVNF